MNMRKFAVTAGLMVAASAAALACSGDDDDNGNPVTTTDGGNVADTGTITTTDGAAAGYTHASVLAFIQGVVGDQFTNDAVVLSYFAPNGANTSMTVTAKSKATLPAIEGCLAYQLGAVLGDGDTYSASAPPVVAGASSDGTDYTCRTDMAAIHGPLEIPGPVFDKFLSDVNAEAMLKGVQLPTAATEALLGLKGEIADPNAPDADLPYGWDVDSSTTTPVDAGTDSSTPVDSGVTDSGADGAG